MNPEYNKKRVEMDDLFIMLNGEDDEVVKQIYPAIEKCVKILPQVLVSLSFHKIETQKFEYKENKHLETTIGQLNFFMWAIKYKILDYVNSSKKFIFKIIYFNFISV